MGKDAGTLESYASEEDLRLEIARRLVANDISDNQLLEFLNAERERFTLSDVRIKHVFVDELIRRKVYPEETVEGNPNDVFTMVEGWGISGRGPWSALIVRQTYATTRWVPRASDRSGWWTGAWTRLPIGYAPIAMVRGTVSSLQRNRNSVHGLP